MIHWPRVKQLRDEVGADEFPEVVQIFMEEVQEMLDRIRADADRSELERNLHFLKGSALSLGFQAFSKLCQDGERQSAAGDAELVDLEEITRTFTVSHSAFLTGLAQNK